jgi:hypothetical protein
VDIPIVPGTYIADAVGSVRRLRLGNSGSLAQDAYYYSGNDVIHAFEPGAMMILVDHLYDTFLRPGTNDLGEKILAAPYIFNGTFGQSWSDFFTKLGQEVRFRNGLDGYVYMDAGVDLSRDTHQEYIDGKNAQVIKNHRDIMPTTCIGLSQPSKVSTDWVPARTWLNEVILSDRYGTDLQEWLDLRRIDDQATYTIKTKEQEWLLEPGDIIHAQEQGGALEEVRVRKAIINKDGTTITAGKRLADLSEKWGMWRNTVGTIDRDAQISKQAFDLAGPSGSQTFVVLAKEYIVGAWKCYLSISWSLDVDQGYTADLPASNFMDLRASVNGVRVPPGRVMATGKSGDITIDITDFCSCSVSADTANTISITLTNGVSTTHYRHDVTGNIIQCRRMEAIQNA